MTLFIFLNLTFSISILNNKSRINIFINQFNSNRQKANDTIIKIIIERIISLKLIFTKSRVKIINIKLDIMFDISTLKGLHLYQVQ